MARPQKPIDPQAGPVGRFAQQLRALRAQAGNPSYRKMQAKGFVSYSSLSRAASGQRLPTWPVVHGYVKACDGDPDEWYQRWLAARDAIGTPDWTFGRAALPDPANITTLAQLRTAIHEIVERHDLGVVSATMREPLSALLSLSRRPEQSSSATFERFLRACGADDAEATAWLHTWHAVVTPVSPPAVTSGRPTNVGTAMSEPTEAARPAAVATLDEPVHPDPRLARDYAELLALLREVWRASGRTVGEVEAATGGRLAAADAAAILSGGRPASGERLVLLLRALGVRGGVAAWVDTWIKVDGATLGRPRRPSLRHYLRAALLGS